MAHWFEMEELELVVRAADDEPPSLNLLRDCVAAIAGALDRPIVLDGAPPMVTFRNHHGAYYNVRIHQDVYRVVYIHSVSQLEFTATRTEELAWKICGYKCTPGEMRAAKERAVRDGFTGEILPDDYFHTPHEPRK